MLKILVTIGATQALAIAINFIRTKMVAVLLGPTGVGVVSMVDQVTQLAAYLSAFNVPFVSLKFLSRAHSQGADEFRRGYASFLKASLLLSALGTLVSLSVVLLRPGLLGAEVARYRTFLALAVLGIPTIILGGFFSNVLAAAQRSRASSTLAVATSAALTVAAYLGIRRGQILGLYAANVVVGVALNLGLWWFLHRTLDLPFFGRGAKISAALRRSPEIISVSLIFYLAALAYSLALLVTRYVLLKNFGEAEAGLLQSVIALAMAIGLVMTPMNGLYLMPLMNREGAPEGKMRTAAEFQKRLIIILSLVAMPMVLFPELLLTFAFSHLFREAGQYLFLFVIAQCLHQMANVYQTLMIGFDDMRMYLLITCAGHLSLAALAWLLAPHYRLLGIAVGFIVAGAVTFSLALARMKLKHGLAVPNPVRSLMLYSLAVIFLAGVLLSRSGDWRWPVALGKVGLYLLFAASFLLFLSKEERSLLTGLWARVRP